MELFLQIMGEVSQRISTAVPLIITDVGISPSEHEGLENDVPNFVDIVNSKINDRADAIIIQVVDYRRLKSREHARIGDVFYGRALHIE